MRSPRFYLSKDTCVKNYNKFFFILRLKTERNFTFSSYCMVNDTYTYTSNKYAL